MTNTASRNKKLMLLSLPILSLLALALLYSWLMRGGCLLWACAPPREFSILDLSIPSHLFPEDAIINALEPDSETFGAREAGNMTVYWSSGRGLAVYIVWQFSSSTKAERFHRQLRLLDEPHYHPTPDVTFNSQSADDLALGCGYSEFGGYRCVQTACYEEFVISFNSIIDDKMTTEQFEEVINYVDTRMGSHMEP